MTVAYQIMIRNTWWRDRWSNNAITKTIKGLREGIRTNRHKSLMEYLCLKSSLKYNFLPTLFLWDREDVVLTLTKTIMVIRAHSNIL